MKYLMGLIFICFNISCLHANTIAGYDFQSYPAKLYQGKKAPLQLGDWQNFRTRLKRAHDDGTINFAGNYIITTWGCGTGCLDGAMIDKRTGIVYDIPIGEGTPYDFGCTYESSNELENAWVVFYPNSRLFVSRNCHNEAIENSNENLETITYFINVWDEKSKQFKLIKQVNQTYKTTSED